jgi:hypothetical protein
MSVAVHQSATGLPVRNAPGGIAAVLGPQRPGSLAVNFTDSAAITLTVSGDTPGPFLLPGALPNLREQNFGAPLLAREGEGFTMLLGSDNRILY